MRVCRDGEGMSLFYIHMYMRDRKYSFLVRINNTNQKRVFFMSVLPKEIVREIIFRIQEKL